MAMDRPACDLGANKTGYRGRKMQAIKILFTIGAVCIGATQASAEQVRYNPDFTFKRVGVPSGSVGNRINVQIAPKPPAPPAAPETATAAVAPAPRLTGLEWFWESNSADLTDTGAGRLEPALISIRNAPQGKSVPAPRLQTLQDIARLYGTDILRETVGTEVSPALVLALISVESSGRSDAVSSAGAQGLMQLMPATADRFGVTNSLDPAQNIRGGVKYLAWLMKHFDNDPLLVLAGYNAGEGSVRDHQGVPPFPETRSYVPKVLAAFAVAKGLCQTPPLLMSDGCVFSVNAL